MSSRQQGQHICLEQNHVYTCIFLSFFLAIYLNINFYIQISSEAEADSYSSSCCLLHKKMTPPSFMHRARVLIPGAISWGLCRDIPCSQQSLHLTISTSQPHESWSPWANAYPHYRLSTQVQDYWMCHWSSSGTYVPQWHGRVENGVRRASALAIGWIKRLQQARRELFAL